jgi:hypothetical protein
MGKLDTSELAITGTGLVIDALGRWSATDIAFIRELHWRPVCDESTGETRTEVTLLVLSQLRPPQSTGWPDLDGGFWAIEVQFENVQEFCLTVKNQGDIQVPGFDLHDFSDRKRQDLHIQVEDYEGGVIAFYARRAQIVSCQKATHPPMVYQSRE